MCFPLGKWYTSADDLPGSFVAGGNLRHSPSNDKSGLAAEAPHEGFPLLSTTCAGSVSYVVSAMYAEAASLSTSQYRMPQIKQHISSSSSETVGHGRGGLTGEGGGVKGWGSSTTKISELFGLASSNCPRSCGGGDCGESGIWRRSGSMNTCPVLGGKIGVGRVRK